MELNDIRKEIDGVDTQLTALFLRRMALSGQVAQCKSEHHLAVLDKLREREILARVSELAGEELEGYIRILYNTIFDLSRSHQRSIEGKYNHFTEEIYKAMKPADAMFPTKGTVACQGVEGAYSQIACDKLFAMPKIMYFKHFEGVFQAVESGLCQYGLLPIENSSYGSINEVYDLMRNYRFHIIRSIKQHINHCVLAKPGTKPGEIREILSHEQAIGQCSAFLAGRTNVKVTVCENTAAAAEQVAASARGDLAAISSHNCASLYGLSALYEHIQNSENNYTRFICIAKDLAIYPGSNRISLMFSVPHEPGSLYRILSKFSALGLNMTKLESRPIPGRDFEFMFYVDLEASVWAPEIIKLLGELSESDSLFVFLGSYSEL